MAAAGMPWFRVDAGWEDHPKIQAFIAAIKQPLGAIYVERLWNHTARYFPDGKIAETTASLERALKWPGRRGKLVAALLMPRPDGSPGLLEGTEGAFTPHDWEEHNGSAFRKFTADRKKRKAPGKPPEKPAETPAEKTSADQPQVQRVYAEFARLNPECCRPGMSATQEQAAAIQHACTQEELSEEQVLQSLAGSRALWEDASPGDRVRLGFLRKLEIILRPKHLHAGLTRLNAPPRAPPKQALPVKYPGGRQSILAAVEALDAQRH